MTEFDEDPQFEEPAKRVAGGAGKLIPAAALSAALGVLILLIYLAY
ncbi:MAG: hypothetical protein HKN14_10170 [Marinicaulis sp.]|nr:hypothetical protein [Marinicaulis sp.]NNE41268.1 hypothetical protein [Marinicaulis sp.]NNL89813.1 hypothetical protein [Marinicaulis sp.]